LPVHKSASKSVQQDKKANMRNRSYKSMIKTARNKLERAISENDADRIDALLREYISKVDRAVSKGIIHRNTGSRKKMRMAQRIRKLGSVQVSATSPDESAAAQEEDHVSS
jgi:small subunit ribosomal protein S20